MSDTQTHVSEHIPLVIADFRISRRGKTKIRHILSVETRTLESDRDKSISSVQTCGARKKTCF